MYFVVNEFNYSPQIIARSTPTVSFKKNCLLLPIRPSDDLPFVNLQCTSASLR